MNYVPTRFTIHSAIMNSKNYHTNENHIKTATQLTISKSNSERFVIKFIDYANSLFMKIHNDAN